MIKTGYFTPRQEIIAWINHVLKTDLSKIEQLGSGSIYCHLLDAAYPGKVPLNKVKWQAYQQIDFIFNFKILQTCFDHLDINKYIDVQKLVKAKYQDNLEFIQWMKWEFSDKIGTVKNYQPEVRRNYAHLNLNFEAINEQTHLHRRRNSFKENVDTNSLNTVRLSLKSPRNNIESFAQTHRQRPQRELRETIKTESTVEKRPLKSSLQKTLYSSFLICQTVKPELILQADEEECF